MTQIRVGTGPYLGELPSDHARSSSKDYIAKARESLVKVAGLENISSRIEEQISLLEKGSIPDFKILTKLEDTALQYKEKINFAAVLETVRFIRQALSLQRYESQTAPIDSEAQLNFSRILNTRIDPITNSGVRTKLSQTRTDYKATATLISNLESLLLLPFENMSQGNSINILRKLSDKGDYLTVVDLMASYLLEQSKSVLSVVFNLVNPDSKFELAVVFGGLANAIATQMALTKVAVLKISDKFEVGTVTFKAELKKVLEGLPHILGQFAKLQVKTLKLIENMNGVISNQDHLYEFNKENFELLNNNDRILLLPTVDFIGKVISLANDNSTITKSQSVKLGFETKYVREDNFADTYTKPTGCPFHHSSSERNDSGFKEEYFKSFDQLIQKAFGLDEINS